MNLNSCISLGALLLVLLSIAPLRPQSSMQEEGEIVIQGRIVLYEWLFQAYGGNVSEDFVVQIAQSENNKIKYIRVVYQVFGSLYGRPFEPVPPLLLLPRGAFVGRGDLWQFSLRKPETPLEKGTCKLVHPDPELEDEMGRVRIPRYIPTPGAQVEDVPPIESLPCYALKHRGLKKISEAKVILP